MSVNTEIKSRESVRIPYVKPEITSTDEVAEIVKHNASGSGNDSGTVPNAYS
ncbi:MAG TPA: hypothetical protein VGV37_21755 [Aliidongia sp.]|uniref:hypothetical protein n=1 Tax=Aliidongia sp. TaxID=1914230 RepID=UPI002DDC9A7B|nr:hypothetical protein [Aliidongia sp.]HEV2677168.1 hypothetical protein [Aliidongia sp.]